MRSRGFFDDSSRRPSCKLTGAPVTLADGAPGARIRISTPLPSARADLLIHISLAVAGLFTLIMAAGQILHLKGDVTSMTPDCPAIQACGTNGENVAAMPLPSARTNAQSRHHPT